MLALKSWRSIESQGTSVPTQGRSSLAHSNQSHLNRKALLNNSKSRIPSPPNFFGRLVLVHRTKQCPPFASAAPFHKKLRRTLSIRFKAHFFKAKTDRKCTGMEVKTAFTNRNLPALFKSLPFQPGNLAATFSINGCTSTLPSFLKCNGKPRYVQGKLLIGQLKNCIIWGHV